MNKALVHRGPDGEGQFAAEGLSMAMRRLSIIDLNTGWQPLYNEDKSIVLMLNGEIYNYIELRAELLIKGHIFSTKSDGETIVHLYEEYGYDCLNHLRGMFALALWDKKRKSLFIARDRMGEKPLYLYSSNNTILYSSELRSLLSSNCIDIKLDTFSVDLFFHYHYVPEPYTPIKNVRKLPAGHYLVIDQGSMKSTEVCYWRMEDSKPLTGNPVETIKEQLHEVSKLVIRADVPVGVALSGGIDSGIVAALAAKHYAGNMHAISVGYDGRPDSDERSDARLVADHLGLEFHDVELSTNEFIENFPAICGYVDDPIADISAFGYYSISKKAKELGIPVMLQGQGGDELFWGYKWVRDNFQYVTLKSRSHNNDPLVFASYYKTKFKEKIYRVTPKEIAKGFLSIFEAHKLYKKHKSEDCRIFPFYDYLKPFNWDEDYYNMLYGEYVLSEKNSLDPYIPFKIDLPWTNPDVILTKLISSTYLLENGITQGDRLSMSNSVELRLPLVDYKFVETVIGLRKTYKDIELSPKFWLKEAGKDLLPNWIFSRRKRGFEPPVMEWMSAILKKYGDLLPSGELVQEGILKKKMAIALSNGLYFPSPAFPSYFNALVLEIWFRNIKSSLIT